MGNSKKSRIAILKKIMLVILGTMSNDLIQTVESTISEDTQSSAKYKSTNFVFNFSSRKNNSNNGSIQNSIQKPLLDSGKQLKSGEPEKKKGSVCLRQDTVV